MKLLIVELWGLGDLTMMTPFLERCRQERIRPMVLCKPHGRELLAESYPECDWIAWDSPWTVFRGKYRLWNWDWGKFREVVRRIRSGNPEMAVSVRRDPRDHGLLCVSGASRRVGFWHWLSPGLLSPGMEVKWMPNFHRVENWWMLEEKIFGNSIRQDPRLVSPMGFKSKVAKNKKRILFHFGARITVRRWPEKYFEQILMRVRELGDMEIGLIPDLDGYGKGLRRLADSLLEGLTIRELCGEISCADVFIANDSGPAHIAAALGVPTATFFGPTSVEQFRPYGEGHLVVHRPLCKYHPCLDRCRYHEPYCMTQLTPDLVWPEVEEWISKTISVN